VDCAIQTYDWTSILGPLWNLRATARNRRQAERIADMVINYRTNHPGRPVYLVGQSGGGAIAVWTAEILPPEYKVDGIILLAASLSPNYILDLAIQNSRRGIVSFYSEKDWLLLGTNVTGTMDGELATSAGRTGFLYPAEGPKPLNYGRLFQVPWDRQMSRAGNTGGHLSSGAAPFVSRYVAPLIGLREWNEQAIERVMASGGAIDVPVAHGPGAAGTGAPPGRDANGPGQASRSRPPPGAVAPPAVSPVEPPTVGSADPSASSRVPTPRPASPAPHPSPSPKPRSPSGWD
jgi:pimeloyl-ACP methyl ester carboxylesterase